MNFEQIKQLDEQYIMHTYKRFEVAFTSGEGAILKDSSDKTYIDFSSGIGTSSLGYNHPDWVKAVTGQVSSLAHCSNLYYNPQMALIAKRICEKTGMAHVFFGNSGAEANEGAIKLARKYSFIKYGEKAQRNIIVTLQNSFHGRTITTLAATGQDTFHSYYFPFTDGFVYAKPDMESVKEVLSDKVCAVMIESIQGEGGVLPLNKTFVQQLRTLLNEKDILLIADEVQTGCGRTGRFLGIDNFDVKPDIFTLAKGLAGGLPIGAVVCNKKLQETFTYGDHGSTFGGNPVSCAGANVVLDKVCDDTFLDKIRKKGQFMQDVLCQTLKENITDIRGFGLMIGIDMKAPLDAKKVATCALNHGVAVLTAKSSLRFLPPLIITEEEIKEGVHRLSAAVNELL